MALLRRIDARDRYWRRNRQPYVEPTEEQKQIEARHREEAIRSVRSAQMKFAAMMGTIEAMAPGVIERTTQMMNWRW